MACESQPIPAADVEGIERGEGQLLGVLRIEGVDEFAGLVTGAPCSEVAAECPVADEGLEDARLDTGAATFGVLEPALVDTLCALQCRRARRTRRRPVEQSLHGGLVGDDQHGLLDGCFQHAASREQLELTGLDFVRRFDVEMRLADQHDLHGVAGDRLRGDQDRAFDTQQGEADLDVDVAQPDRSLGIEPGRAQLLEQGGGL